MSQVQFSGMPVSLETTYDAMAKAYADPDAEYRQLIADVVAVIGDGSGTVIFKPTRRTPRSKTYCFWKKAQQWRWYIIVDVSGRILFVSVVYPGKLDDTRVLPSTAFYPCVPRLPIAALLFLGLIPLWLLFFILCCVRQLVQQSVWHDRLSADLRQAAHDGIDGRQRVSLRADARHLQGFDL